MIKGAAVEKFTIYMPISKKLSVAIVGVLQLLFVYNSYSQCAPMGAIEYNPVTHTINAIPAGIYKITSDLAISGSWVIPSGVSMYVDVVCV